MELTCRAMANHSKRMLGFLFCMFLVGAEGASMGDVTVSETGLLQGVKTDPLNSSSIPISARANAALLMFRVRFADGLPVPLAQAQLLSQGGSQINTTRSDGGCSFQVDPTKAHSLLLTAQGSANSAGSIALNRAIGIPPFDVAASNGVRDFGDIVIPFVSFCSGTLAYRSDSGGFIAGNDPLHTLQSPDRTCTWNLGPFPNQASIALYVQWFDVSSGDVMTVTAVKQDGSAPQVVLQLGANLSTGQTDYLAITVPAPQASIVLATGKGPQALTYGFVMYYRVNYLDDTSPLLTVSLVWAAGGCLIIVIIFLVVIILKRRQRRRGPLTAPALLSWDRAKATSAAEPDPLNHDVMVVTWPGGEARRVALPQKVWRTASKFIVEPSVLCATATPTDSNKEPPKALGSSGTNIPLTQNLSAPDHAIPNEARSDADNSPGAPSPNSDAPPAVHSDLRLASEGARSQAAVGKALSECDAREDVGGSAGAGIGAENGTPGDETEHADSCAICLVEYEDGALLRPLLCGHAFHTACIDTWLKKDPSCPLCKRPLCSLSSKTSGDQVLELGQLSTGGNQPGPSSAAAEAGGSSTGADLEAGGSAVSHRSFASGNPVENSAVHEAYERAELDERADRQRATNPSWYMHQWLAWGW